MPTTRVPALRTNPRDRVLVTQVEHPPFTKQGSLAEPRRSTDEGQLAPHAFLEAFAQPRTRHQVGVRSRYIKLGLEQRFGRDQPPIEQDRTSAPFPTQAL